MRPEPTPPSWILAPQPNQFLIVPAARIQIPTNCLVISRPNGELSLLRRDNNGSSHAIIVASALRMHFIAVFHATFALFSASFLLRLICRRVP